MNEHCKDNIAEHDHHQAPSLKVLGHSASTTFIVQEHF